MIYTFLFFFTLGVITYSTVIAILNALFAKRLTSSITTDTSHSEELISILIPARNEQANILPLLQSLTRQTYTNIQIHVLDDESSDNTLFIALKYAESHPNIYIHHGDPTPSGWGGKNWACHQLSKYANGDLLLFIDCDTILDKRSITLLLEIYKKNSADLLSVFPTAIYTKEQSNKLLIPITYWMLLAVMPFLAVERTPFPAYAAATGALMLFNKETYLTIGGHKTTRNMHVEDMILAKRAKEAGKRITLILGGKYVTSYMYKTQKGAFNGISRSFYRGSGLTPMQFIFTETFYCFCFIFPFFAIFFNNAYLLHIILIEATVIAIYTKTHQNILFEMLITPFQMILMYMLALDSVIKHYTSGYVWRGRVIHTRKNQIQTFVKESFPYLWRDSE